MMISDTFRPIIEPLNKIHKQQQQQQLQPQQYFKQLPSDTTVENVKNERYDTDLIKDENFDTTSFNNSDTEMEEEDHDTESIDREDFSTSHIDYSDIYRQVEYFRDIDKVYGVKKLGEDLFILGRKVIKFTQNEIHIDDADNPNTVNNTISYPLTSGLCYLLFAKNPKGYSADDIDTYRKIMIQTSGHLKKNTNQIKSSRGRKADLIASLFSDTNDENIVPVSPDIATVGKGVNMHLQKYNLIYWNDVNELVERLRLLFASLAAGNTGVRNEIIAICEELVERKLLKTIPNV